MLVRLFPSQISSRWMLIKESILHSLPPDVEETPVLMANILNALNVGDMQCWFIQEAGEDNGEVLTKAVVVTTLNFDRFSGGRSLIVYSVYSFAKWGDHEGWKECWEELVRFARENGCTKIIGYTNKRALVEWMMDDVGAEAVQVVIVANVPLRSK